MMLDILGIANLIVTSKDIRDSITIYGQYRELLKSFRFIWFQDDFGQELPEYLVESEIQNFTFSSLATSKKIFVLDDETYNDMAKYGKTNYFIDTCVCLDTQAVSYLKNVFLEDSVMLTEETRFFIDYFIRNNLNFDFQFYMFENSLKLGVNVDKRTVFENLLACERFKNIDREKYINEGKFAYIKENGNILYDTDQTFYLMNIELRNSEVKDIFRIYYAIEAILLKMTIIEFKNKEKGIKFKIQQMIDFINNELGCFFEREVAICYLFWKRDNKVMKFFKRIQINNKKILLDIKGMAWDLFHIRHLEYNMANINVNGCRYEINSILTFDNGLRDVLKAYPIKSCMIYDGNFIPIFKNSISQLIVEVEDIDEQLSSKQDKRRKMQVNVEKLVLELEKELKDLL